MCGINGLLRLSPAAPALDPAELARSRDAMAARGPDGCGAWIDPQGEAALGSRRLRILDLTAAGDQPIASLDGRYRIVYNGEIYNFRALRRELLAAGVPLRSHSDTEVLVELYARQQLAMLSRLRGMYALAIWDIQARELLLARDPLGIKPLYYSRQGDMLRFASQVKALVAGGAISPQVDAAGLVGFLVWGAVPEPFTLRRDVRALPAGHFLLAGDGRVVGPRPIPGLAEGSAATAGAVGATAIGALEDSVRAHLESDVPVAIFLSAGLDSALVAALACRHLEAPPATFTLTFDRFAGTPHDEGPLAAAVARTLGTDHRERRIADADLAALWPRAMAAMDQPSIDGFNTFLVSQVAAEAGFKVALSGLGGDELFGSYPSFRDVPRWARAAAAGRRLPGLSRLWPRLARRLFPARPKLPALLAARGLAAAYVLRRGLYLPAELPALLGEELANEGLAAYSPVLDAGLHLGYDAHGRPDPWLAVHRMESALYMRNQLLRDADWASMAHSLELRVPLVDAWLERRLAAHRFEPARSHGKAELVRRAAPELPSELFGRKKSGFSIPLLAALESRAGRAGTSGPARSAGFDSRVLALRVLAESGVELAARAAR